MNAKKLKGSNVDIGEQFPEEIVKILRELYPERKKAKLMSDELTIKEQVFYKPNQ